MRKLLVALPVLAVLFSACSINNVTVDDSLGRFFDSAGVKGCFAFFDNGQGRFTIYDLPRYRDSAYAPGATFDIVQSLIALQTGVLSNEKTPFVGMAGGFNDDVDSARAWAQRLETAGPDIKPNIGLRNVFTLPNGPVRDMAFQALTMTIGKDTLKKWVDSLHYGNQDLGGPLDSCWIDGHLRIPADEELGLIKKLYFNQLPFFRRPQEIVRELMKKESTTNYTLVYKTAVVPEKDRTLGWVLGWVEENKHPYFFVMNFDATDQNTDVTEVGTQIVKHILSSMGFFQGKK